MDSFRFRPIVTGLEDRITPAVSVAEGTHVASVVTSFFPSMVWLAQNQNTLSVFRHRATLATALPNIFQATLHASNILTEHKVEMQTLMANDPGTVGLLGPYIDYLSEANNQARAMAEFSFTLGHAYGAPDSAFIPQTPPPPPPPAVDETDAGMTDTLPDVNAEGFRTTDSGLRIRDVVEGTGDAVVADGDIKVHYTGWLLDGTVFDSSRPNLSPRGDSAVPLETPLSGVIQGWQEGVPGMKPGGIRHLVIPSALAYGSTGSGNIPPNADLVFEIKLISTSPPSESA